MLHEALINKAFSVAEKLIEKGADVNIKNKVGFTPLHEACARGGLSVVEKILSKGGPLSSIDSKNINGMTPLQESILGGHLQIAEKLLGRGDVNVNTQNNDGFAPLHEVAIHNHPSIIDRMIDAHADVNIRNKYGLTPLFESIIHGNALVATNLIDKGANVNVGNAAGFSPLHESIIRGLLTVSDKLIDNGADLSAKNNDGFSPIHEAIIHNRLSVLDTILSKVKGTEINIKNNGGFTPLHEAVIHNRLQAIEKLIKKGADRTITDNRGQTPLELAKSRGNFASQNLLKSGQTSRTRREVNTKNPTLRVTNNLDTVDTKDTHPKMLIDSNSSIASTYPQLQTGSTQLALPGQSSTQLVSNNVTSGTTMLLDLITRKITGKKHLSTSNVPLSVDKYLEKKVSAIEQLLKNAQKAFPSSYLEADLSIEKTRNISREKGRS